MSLTMALLLTSCASGPPRTPLDQIERALAGAPGLAQPSRVVATEIAFARAARENGQWTAFREFAADNAVLHGRSGPIAAKPWLSAQNDPDKAVQWSPRSVWMSCDSRLAISFGRFRDPEGVVGRFVTVWERQSDEDYRWSYDLGAPDDPQPQSRQAVDPADEAEIVVTAIEDISGFVADCPKRGEALPQRAVSVIADNARSGTGLSPDGTLAWRWEHQDNGARRFVADFLTSGRWENAVDLILPASPDEK